MEVNLVSTHPPKKSPRGPLRPEEKERCKREKLCGYFALATCGGGIASDTSLCPFVIAKEAVKAQGKARR
jgi:hypothetical protein